MDIYLPVLGATFLLLLLFFMCHAIVRFYKWFTDYVDDNKIDTFEKSFIMEVGYNHGTHPAGIIGDVIICCSVSFFISLAWPILWSVLIVYSIARYVRHKRQEAKAIMNKLSGSEKY